MNNSFYFLRHGHTKADKDLPISQWVLSSRGEEQAQKLVEEGIFKDIDLIFSSTEKKAYQTAKPIADALGKEIVQIEELSELDRDKGGFMGKDEYEETVKKCLGNLNQSINHWETANHALNRFSRKIDELDKEYEDKKILVVGHGFTINMYFSKLLGVLDKVYQRVQTNDYADWGVVSRGRVVEDITS
jgi:broad specificity phosphatase PhoE